MILIKTLYDCDNILSGPAEQDSIVYMMKKLTNCNPLFFTKEQEELYNSIPLTSRELLICILGMTGGVFKSQLSYLKDFENAASLRSLIHRINIDSSLIETVRIASLGGNVTFLRLTSEGYKVYEELAKVFGMNTEHEPVDTEASNIEHSSGYIDYLLYLLGNNNHSGSISFLREQCLELDAFSFVRPDAQFISIPTPLVRYIDFLEVHTGSQRGMVVRDKLLSYARQLKNMHPSDASSYEMSIIFCIHQKDMYADLTRRQSCIPEQIQPECDTELFCGISTLFAFSGALTVGEVLAQDIEYYIDLFDSQVGFDIGFVIKAYDFLKKYLSEHREASKNTVKGLFRKLFSTNGVSLVYDRYYQNYCNQVENVFSSAMLKLREDYTEDYFYLREECMRGLSICTCFGPDLYDTALLIHPFMTGAAAAVEEMLLASGLIQLYSEQNTFRKRQCSHKSIKITRESGDDAIYFFKDCVHLSADWSSCGYYSLEYLSHDEGTKIRLRRSMEFVGLSEYKNIRNIYMVDTLKDAYLFIVERCMRILLSGNRSLLSFSSLLPDQECTYTNICRRIKDEHLNLPLFITKESIESWMKEGCNHRGYTERCELWRRPFILANTNFFEDCYNAYSNEHSATFDKASFYTYFKKKLCQEDLKDINNECMNGIGYAFL